MAEAIYCTLRQWPEMSVFQTDGAVSIDSNVSMHEMRRVVLTGRTRAFLLLLGIQEGACGGVFIGGKRPSVSRPQLHLQEKCSNLFDGDAREGRTAASAFWASPSSVSGSS